MKLKSPPNDDDGDGYSFLLAVVFSLVLFYGTVGSDVDFVGQIKKVDASAKTYPQAIFLKEK